MHPYSVSDSVRQTVLRRRDRLIAMDELEGPRTAFVVVDMQNYFVGKGFPSEVPMARSIVPAINTMAAAVRAAGGTVIWIQTTSVGALETWVNHHRCFLSPAAAARRIAQLAEDTADFRLFPELDARPEDLRVKKIKFSAMIQGSSELPAVLAGRGIDTLLIGGTTTNVCCESTARDAAMLDFRVAMLSDCNATWTDAQHAGTLDNFQIVFGDVMNNDEAIARLVPAAQRRSA